HSHERHRCPQRDHDLKAEVNRRDRRPQLAPKRGQSLHLRAWIVKGERRESARNLDRESSASRVLIGPTAETQRSTALRVELALERRELDRLPPRNHARAEVAGQ